MTFDARYKLLNSSQKEAVDTIDGPVMVIAGPGTGKTELLGMRAANILKQTDVLPENILCLTFTDAGSIAMKRRLIEIIGRDAYNVSVYTFHSFGSDIMNRYREYFMQGADFKPADDLARHKIVTEILDSLKYNDPLRSSFDGQYTAIRDVIDAISDLKRAGLTDGEFIRLLDSAEITIDSANKLLSQIFSSRVTKKTRDELVAAIPTLQAIDEDTTLEGITLLKDVLIRSLEHALERADEHPRVTPPLTAWKDEWMTHAADKNKTLVLKMYKNLPKLRSLAHVYGLYLEIMQKAQLYDYDDMIMNLVHAIELNNDLRYDLQEKYQYIMVDEFQDTNMAQMRILHSLTNNPVVEDRPNILVVGDDDQAIYGFQGAEVGNILQFDQLYPATKRITLTDNYRSTQDILTAASEVISQGTERLETIVDGLDKSLTAHKQQVGEVAIAAFQSVHDERNSIAEAIKTLIESGVPPNQIAIIARQHKDLVSLIGYLTERHIPLAYDRRENVLDDEVVIHLEHLARIVTAINAGDHVEANELLPSLLSHPAWGLPPVDVWEISLTAHKKKQDWLEIIRDRESTKAIFHWLIETATQVELLPLERMIDVLLGLNNESATFSSPIKNYYFPETQDTDDASRFIAHLKNLTAIRAALRDHRFESEKPLLADFLDFLAENRAAGIRMTALNRVGEDSASVQLLTAHGSKGLEFEYVFIMNATDSTWGQKVSSRSSQVMFPPHLRLRQHSDNYNERLRLFFVGMTRAKKSLSISFAHESASGKEQLPAAFLIGNSIPVIESTMSITALPKTETEMVWYAPVLDVPKISMHQLLAPVISNYKLSATHLNQFLDVSRGGPRHFLLNSILRFPHERSAAASYGNAIHLTLQKVHNHVRATGSMLPEEDILNEFEKIMDSIAFTTTERRHYLHKGTDALSAFLRVKQNDFRPTQLAELDFSRQDVYLGDAHLTGKLDVVEFDPDAMTASVTDYKTGASLSSWRGKDTHQKIKAHKYRQQLLFYKLLIENSRDWRKYSLEHAALQFVEPTPSGEIIDLQLQDISPEELDRFEKLVAGVWKLIQSYTFPDTSHYAQTLDGIIAFEDAILTDTVK